MQSNNRDVEIYTRDQSQDQINTINNVHHDEDNDRMLIRQEVINELETNISQAASNSADSRSIIPESELKRSPDLAEISRSETVRQDVRRLKSVTLGRMGKMFKTRMPIVERSSLGLNTDMTSIDDNDEKALKKEKTNSLGRMLKLVDKNGSPKKFFIRPQAGTLSRILRRHSHNENNEVIDKSAEDSTRGIFSRMLNQLREK